MFSKGSSLERYLSRERSLRLHRELPDIAIELAGPWNFYAEFRRAHELENLPHPEPPEIALQAGTTLVIPLLAAK